jgi:perosamine synthetase
MEDWKIPLYKIYTDDEDVKIVNNVIKRGSRWAIGPEVAEFENLIKNYVGTDYCVSVNSGTSALHATLLAYEIGNNDEVIIPSFSFISTANSILFVNGTPIFSDIEQDHFGLDPNLLLDKITSNTKAIMPMDYAGQSCKINDIKEIAQEKNLLLIEDAAEGLGSSVKGKKVGSLSDSAIFSFTGNKVLTMGEGGAIVTNSKEIFEKLQLIRSHGRLDTTNYFDNPFSSEYLTVGYNWRMPTIVAALGIAQMNKIDKIIKMRQALATHYSKRISKHSDILIPLQNSSYDHIYQMYTILLPNSSIRQNLQKFLASKRIFSKIYFPPIHLTKFYQKHFNLKNIELPVTEKISQQVLTLPLYPNMSMEERDYLLDAIDEFFEIKIDSK